MACVSSYWCRGSVNELTQLELRHSYFIYFSSYRVKTTTLRKVIREGATGSTTSTKIKLTLTIEVQKVSFDADGCTLHLCGVNVEESQYVKLGGTFYV